MQLVRNFATVGLKKVFVLEGLFKLNTILLAYVNYFSYLCIMIKSIINKINDEAYKYMHNSEHIVPLDDEGNVLMEYIQYVSLKEIHDLLEATTRDMATIIISPTEDDDETARVTADSSFFIVPDETMVEIITALRVIDEQGNMNGEQMEDNDLTI